MRTDRIIFGSLALATTLVVSACSSTQQLAQRDDLYNNQAKAPHDYESPDYYYTDAGSQNEAYNEQAYQDENYEDGGYYADEYSDEEYVEGTEYDSNLEYANRINRFYYGAPGIPYYDPWFDPWYGYTGFGLGFGYGGWGSSWSLGFGFGSPYYGYGWGSPYYGFGYGGWGGYPYWGYSAWGHPYYGYGSGYYGGSYYYGSRPRVRSAYGPSRIAARNGYSTRRGTRSAVNSTRISRDRNGRIVSGRTTRTTTRGTTRTAVGSRAGVRTVPSQGTRRPSTVGARTRGAAVGRGTRTTTSPVNGRNVSRSPQARPTTRPATSRPNVTRPSTTRPTRSAPSYTPSRSSGGMMGGGMSRGGGGSSRAGRTR